MTAPVCFVDVESLGLDADLQPVWEVAIIRPNGDEHVIQVQVSPRDISLAHPKALEINGFAERYDQDKALPPPVAAKKISRWLDGCHLAGAVVSFDEERLRRMCWKFRQPVTWHHRLLCVETYAAGYFGWEVPVGLSEVAERLGLEVPEAARHTALGDARTAKTVYAMVMALQKGDAVFQDGGQ